MKTRPILVTLLLSSCLAPSCDSSPSELPEMLEPPEDYPLAFYHLDCAPWDGAAVSLYLVQEAMTMPFAAPLPHLRVSVYEAIPGLVGETFQWGGYAGRCPIEGACESATSARIRFRSWDAEEGRLAGDVELQFPDGSSEAGAFDGALLDFQPLCG